MRRLDAASIRGADVRLGVLPEFPLHLLVCKLDFRLASVHGSPQCPQRRESPRVPPGEFAVPRPTEASALDGHAHEQRPRADITKLARLVCADCGAVQRIHVPTTRIVGVDAPLELDVRDEGPRAGSHRARRVERVRGVCELHEQLECVVVVLGCRDTGGTSACLREWPVQAVEKSFHHAPQGELQYIVGVPRERAEPHCGDVLG